MQSIKSSINLNKKKAKFHGKIALFEGLSDLEMINFH